jgi:hypothetical protein
LQLGKPRGDCNSANSVAIATRQTPWRQFRSWTISQFDNFVGQGVLSPVEARSTVRIRDVEMSALDCYARLLSVETGDHSGANNCRREVG